MGRADILLQSADSIAKPMNICLPGMTSVNGSSAGRTGACRKKRINVNARKRAMIRKRKRYLLISSNQSLVPE